MKGTLINKNMWKFVDWFLVVIIFILVGYSLLSIVNVTASPFTGDEQGFAELFANLNLSSALWQLLFFGIGVVLMFLVMLVDYHTIAHFTDWIYWAAVALLIAVRFLGSTQNGTTGWFMIGNRGFQPGELCKILMIVVLAKVTFRQNRRAMKTVSRPFGKYCRRSGGWRFRWRLIASTAGPGYGDGICRCICHYAVYG